MNLATSADWTRLKDLWIAGDAASLDEIPALCASLARRLRESPIPHPQLVRAIARLAENAHSRAIQSAVCSRATGRYSRQGAIETAAYIPTIGWEA